MILHISSQYFTFDNLWSLLCSSVMIYNIEAHEQRLGRPAKCKPVSDLATPFALNFSLWAK